MNNKLVIFISLIFLILTISSVSAAENITQEELSTTIDTDFSLTEVTSDDNDVLSAEPKDIYVGEDKEYKNLKDALDAASENDTIYISSGVYSGEKNTNLTIEKNNIKIQAVAGETVTFDGKNTYKIFTIDADNVLIKRLNFENAYLTGQSNGAAIEWIGVNGTVVNSNFRNNKAEDDGGAIFWKGNNGQVINCIFDSNYGRSGSAIASEFNGNDEYGFNLTIKDSTFKNNNASSQAAVYLHGKNSTVMNSTFYNCTSNGKTDYSRAALVIWEQYNRVDNCTFENNTAQTGGCVNWVGSDGILSNSRFINNYNNISAVGSGVYWAGENGLITGCEFENNTAGSGSSIFWTGYKGILENTTFKNDVHNFGTVYWSGEKGLINNSTFLNSYANLWGSAVYFGSAGGIINNSFFKNNTAVHAAGGIYSNGLNTIIDNCTFVNNTSLTNEGGAVHVEGKNTTLSNSNLTYNTGRIGGAVNWKAAEGLINNCNFYNNTGRVEGGAVRVDGLGNLTINHSTFEENRAPTGSAIYNAGNLGVENSTILENKADAKVINVNSKVNKTNVTLDVIFEGGNNLLNGIYDFTGNITSIKNVKYLGVNGVMNTDEGNYVENTTEPDQDVTVVIYDKNNNVILNITDKTGLRGNVTLNLTLSPGTYKVNAYHISDEYYTGITGNGEFTVEKFNSTIILSAEDVYYKEDVIVIANVSAGATGNVTFYFGSYSEEVPIINNQAKFTIPDLIVNNYTISAKYAGDDNFTASENDTDFKVMKINSTVIITVKDIYYKENALIHVEVIAGATGNVTINVAGTNYTLNIGESKKVTFLLAASNSASDDPGEVDLTLSNLNAGDYEVKVTYNGDNNYYSSSNNTNFTVKKLPTNVKVSAKPDVKVGKNNVITVSNLPKEITEKVTVTVNDKNYTATVKNGQAKLTLRNLASGEYNISVYYDGDKNYYGSNASTSFTVTKYTTPIKITSKDIKVGEDGIITVKVPKHATGNITISIDGKNYTSPIINGVATFIIPGLNKGSYEIQAFYDGDDSYLPANATGTINVLDENNTGIVNNYNI